jgi:MYND finger
VQKWFFAPSFAKHYGRGGMIAIIEEYDTVYRYLISHGTCMLLSTTGNIENNHNIAVHFANAIIQIETIRVDGDQSDQKCLEEFQIMTELFMSLDSKRNLVRFFASRIPCRCLDQKKREYQEKLGKCNNRNCGKSVLDATLMNCGNCQIYKYCSKDCQAQDWPEHKKVCRILTGKAKPKK